MRTPNEIIDDIQRIRAHNNETWMRLVRLAWELDPATARSISAEITGNDSKILELSKELAATDENVLAKEAVKAIDRRAVILPGGGVLHTYAVREALALGLTPIVTDRDKDCPCAKMEGVEFHKIDCYDVEAHVLLANETRHLVGAFCGGADTHVVVASIHDANWVGRWVSKQTAETCKDKLKAKEALLKAGVPTAKPVNSNPCIVKPRRGSGSREVTRYISGRGTPLHLFNSPDEPPSEFFREELLEGHEQSVEILLEDSSYRPINIVDRYFAWVDDQPLEIGHTNPTRLDEKTQKALYLLAFNAARAVGADVGFFKIDSILTKNGPKVLECTPRLSGGYDAQFSTPMSSGRNLLRYGLQIACGLPRDESLLTRTKSETVTILHRPHLMGAEQKK